jgi:hypothetical protein
LRPKYGVIGAWARLSNDNERLFTSYRHARNSLEEWRINMNRPHTSLDGLTPYEFANRFGTITT